MSTRAMLFIDGTWLSVTANRMAEQFGVLGRTGGPLDFGALPRVCAAEVMAQMESGAALDVVRTHYFGSIAANFDPADQDAVQRRSDFFDALRRQHRYEVYRFETDYRGGRVRREFRGADNGFEPREKAVDVGLATALLEMAALSAYDIAIVVCGDRDFVPALQAVRRLGKRVALVSARGSCPREFSDPNDPARLRDFDMLWLDTLWPQLVSPAARPALRVVHDESPYLDVPVAVPATALADTLPSDSVRDVPQTASDEAPLQEPGLGIVPVPRLHGLVIKTHASGYGFIRSDEGGDYYFRRSDLDDASLFGRLSARETRVQFAVRESPGRSSAGKAMQVTTTTGLRATIDPSLVTVPDAPVAPAAVVSRPVDALWDADPFAPPRRSVDGGRW